ncbi:OLC1v1005562C1 [Oldenlandia corymbosa var. corymbosa]|uniref:Dirigent protein n=1 Tax=Oldenlandia corymbosa var. corymbosa TaxID=529605 RepID=A0AAV1DFK3_OLDCO|nr:OLC1v1005562C1 [Oldenlandia corymbosa var. corymbosa]
MKRRKFLTTRFILLVFVIMATMAESGRANLPRDVEKRLRSKLSNAVEKKLTKLKFYCHENIYGKNPTAVPVAKASSNVTSGLSTLFGLVMVVDNKLTVGPEPDSKLIGYARGIYASASRQREEALLTIVNFVFTDGKYKGSALSVLGRNPIFHGYRELPVVGGSGGFQLARGSATAETYTFDRISGDPIVEYNVIVLHY